MNQESEYSEEQRRYWDEMCILKVNALYANKLSNRLNRTANNIYSANTIASLLGGAIWLAAPGNWFSYIIGAILVIWQLLRLVWPTFFNQREYALSFSYLSSQLESLFFEAEDQWFKIKNMENNMGNNEEVHKKTMSMIKRSKEIIDQYKPQNFQDNIAEFNRATDETYNNISISYPITEEVKQIA